VGDIWRYEQKQATKRPLMARIFELHCSRERERENHRILQTATARAARAARAAKTAQHVKTREFPKMNLQENLYFSS